MTNNEALKIIATSLQKIANDMKQPLKFSDMESSDMKRIVICKHCNKVEYWGEMRMVDGYYSCRDCYKARYEEVSGLKYAWDDLDGPRPTVEEYNKQQEQYKER